MLISATCLARANISLKSLSRVSSVNIRQISSDSEKKPGGFFEKTFGLSSNTGRPDTNRWSMFVPAFCTHVCLGAPYGWSAISAQLTRENGEREYCVWSYKQTDTSGLVTSAASDWALDLASYPMSVMIAAGGLSAAALGKWTIKAGVRKALAFGGLLYGAGFGVAALGVSSHNIGLMYFGNLLCGIG